MGCVVNERAVEWLRGGGALHRVMERCPISSPQEANQCQPTGTAQLTNLHPLFIAAASLDTPAEDDDCL